MDTQNRFANKILIVDDSDMNRDILSDMIENRYDILEAENGEEALKTIKKHYADIVLILLDLNMPVMNGYQLLEIMQEQNWIADIPVIIISEESRPDNIQQVYEMGVTDFIARPFNRNIVIRRVTNTIQLYEKQRRLTDLVIKQIQENERQNKLMISVLSHIVEFRNGESGLHVLHVQAFTGILLKTLMGMADNPYRLTQADITTIANASALHDIGKISIPSEILNKPGRLTPEEFTIMKTHSQAGADMLAQLSDYSEEPLVKRAYEITRWHHERYDGRGYPDGLKGDEIPISAQIVALADVYDALTSERVYKAAFSHETAMEMILGGKCGTFNPLLMECLQQAENEMRGVKNGTVKVTKYNEIINVAEEISKHEELSTAKQTFSLLHDERTLHEFFFGMTEDILFEYSKSPELLSISAKGAACLNIPEVLVNPLESEILQQLLSPADMKAMEQLASETTAQEPDFTYRCQMTLNEGKQAVQFQCRSTWSIDTEPERTGLLGKLIIG